MLAIFAFDHCLCLAEVQKPALLAWANMDYYKFRNLLVLWIRTGWQFVYNWAQLAQAVSFPVGRRLGGWLAIFSHRRSAQIKNLVSKTWREHFCGQIFAWHPRLWKINKEFHVCSVTTSSWLSGYSWIKLLFTQAALGGCHLNSRSAYGAPRWMRAPRLLIWP